MEPLKNLINQQLVEEYANELAKNLRDFSKSQFLHFILTSDWEQRELMDRIQHVADAIHEATVGSFDEIVSGLEKSAPNLPSGFEQIIFPAFVKKYGMEHFDRSMLALERLTVYSTGEFAIRPFIKAFPEKTMAQMSKWSEHDNEHVRRLSSEGCRPRLPWGGNIKLLIEDPDPIFPILKKLRNDESLYVRKSVANNLNDISKDHPETVLRIGKCWINENKKNSTWVVKRALRTLLKQSNPKALELFGFDSPDRIKLKDFSLSSNVVSIGSAFTFDFKLVNTSEQPKKLRVEYLVDFKKKHGSAKKVFQISEFDLPARSFKNFTKAHSFKELTTRKHYVGSHSLCIRINGVEQEPAQFSLER